MLLNEKFRDLTKGSMVPCYEDYLEGQFKEDFDQYFVSYYKGSRSECAGVIRAERDSAVLPNYYEDAINFCVANYFKILESRVVGFVHGTDIMRKFLKGCHIVEMDCSKGPVAFPLSESGLIPPAEFEADFMAVANGAADFHWTEVREWAESKKLGGIPGMERLFRENVREYLPLMFRRENGGSTQPLPESLELLV